MGIAGAQYVNIPATVGTTQSTILIPAVPNGGQSQHNGKLLIQNPHPTAKVYVGLGGESNLSTSSYIGFYLAPAGGYVAFDLGEAPQNAITAISDTASTPLTIYAIGG